MAMKTSQAIPKAINPAEPMASSGGCRLSRRATTLCWRTLKCAGRQIASARLPARDMPANTATNASPLTHSQVPPGTRPAGTSSRKALDACPRSVERNASPMGLAVPLAAFMAVSPT